MGSGRIVIERPDLFDGRTSLRGDICAVVLGMGTGHGEWALPGSLFRRQVIEPAGIVVAVRIFGPERLLFPRRQWRQIGDDLADLLRRCRLSVCGHSHFLQPAAEGIEQASAVSWVSVSGPVRPGMDETYAAAASNCERVIQIADAGTDMTQIAGQYLMRTASAAAAVVPAKFGLRSRDFPAAPNVLNVRLPDVGHSRILYDPICFDLARQWIVPALTAHGEQMRRA